MEKEEKKYFIAGVIVGAAVVGTIAFAIYTHQGKTLKRTISVLTSELESSVTEMGSVKKELVGAYKRIDELKALCLRKDACFKEVISDGLRHGSSLSGFHMADRRAYLDALAKAV